MIQVFLPIVPNISQQHVPTEVLTAGCSAPLGLEDELELWDLPPLTEVHHVAAAQGPGRVVVASRLGGWVFGQWVDNGFWLSGGRGSPVSSIWFTKPIKTCSSCTAFSRQSVWVLFPWEDNSTLSSLLTKVPFSAYFFGFFSHESFLKANKALDLLKNSAWTNYTLKGLSQSQKYSKIINPSKKAKTRKPHPTPKPPGSPSLRSHHFAIHSDAIHRFAVMDCPLLQAKKLHWVKTGP